MDATFGRETFDGGDGMTFGTKGRDNAAMHRLAIEQHGAGAAVAGIAAFLDAEMTELAQECAQALAGLRLTITASTKRPVRIALPTLPDTDTLEEAILDRIPDNLYHDDVHGKPAWRKQMTLRLAEEIRTELQGFKP